jgi:hypothetical protein
VKGILFSQMQRLPEPELRSVEAMEPPERARARSAPKRRAMAERPSFSQFGRWLDCRIASHRVRTAEQAAKLGQ